MTEALTKEEFCDRLVAEILRATSHRTDLPKEYFEEYAQEVAPTYWQNERDRKDGPEACAQGDMDCWE